MKFENFSYAYDFSIKNIVFASQMCHKHILKLIGCCLETIVPVLVFEPLVNYGTLKDHICRYYGSHFESLSWKQRLKISVEIANAFAYLHVGFPRPIVYSLMSSSQFLLDENCVPKLFDFSHAECIPEGETQIKDTEIRGHLGYLAPEHVLKKVLDERCDVFGFGSLLLELLTGQGLVEFFDSSARKYGDRYVETKDVDWLWKFMKKINENNRFVEIVDPIIVGDGLSPEIEQKLKVFAQLAAKCQSYSAEDRPTMIDVAKQLRQLYLSAT
ncbi:hypothetical protein Ddye_028179 [Dipteronia dyeriana]|uniref:Protein kinase domain-containing protein n=1 Tax=Dipteronia dyeriana TaxID=168575 RepID=A0AAD9TRF5_9ROSI|nr:hypothetical protein Ddye_028179 [Dipteronia dyeriana]